MRTADGAGNAKAIIKGGGRVFGDPYLVLQMHQKIGFIKEIDLKAQPQGHVRPETPFIIEDPHACGNKG